MYQLSLDSKVFPKHQFGFQAWIHKRNHLKSFDNKENDKGLSLNEQNSRNRKHGQDKL